MRWIQALLALLVVGGLYNLAYWLYRQPPGTLAAITQPFQSRISPSQPPTAPAAYTPLSSSAVGHPSTANPSPAMDLAEQATPVRADCEGHTRCGQMHSCAEAKMWLQRCADVAEMDGDGDGVPCERQWCHGF